MSKNQQPIKSLPNGQVPKYGVSGVTPEQEAMIRAHLSDMAPDVYPDQVAFLPAEQFRKIADQISRQGTLGNAKISKGEGAQERWGGSGATNIANAFSMRSTGRMYVNADLLNPKRSNDLKDVLGHELGHFSAPANDQSEDTANKWRDQTYRPREKQQEALTKEVSNLPARQFLGSAMPSIEATPPPQQASGATQAPASVQSTSSSLVPKIQPSEEELAKQNWIPRINIP